VRRQVVVLTLLVLSVLQNAMAGYTMNVGRATGSSPGISSPCAAGAGLPLDDECCKHHSRQSMPPSCLAHCAAIVALVPALTGFHAAKSHSPPVQAPSPWSPGAH